jgi:hypothetical protein
MRHNVRLGQRPGKIQDRGGRDVALHDAVIANPTLAESLDNLFLTLD